MKKLLAIATIFLLNGAVTAWSHDHCFPYAENDDDMNMPVFYDLGAGTVPDSEAWRTGHYYGRNVGVGVNLKGNFQNEFSYTCVYGVIELELSDTLLQWYVDSEGVRNAVGEENNTWLLAGRRNEQNPGLRIVARSTKVPGKITFRDHPDESGQSWNLRRLFDSVGPIPVELTTAYSFLDTPRFPTEPELIPANNLSGTTLPVLAADPDTLVPTTYYVWGAVQMNFNTRQTDEGPIVGTPYQDCLRVVLDNIQ